MMTYIHVQDAFRDGNVLQLIARATGYPLQIRSSNLFGNGSFVKNDSEYCHHIYRWLPIVVLDLRHKIYRSVLISELS